MPPLTTVLPSQFGVFVSFLFPTAHAEQNVQDTCVWETNNIITQSTIKSHLIEDLKITQTRVVDKVTGHVDDDQYCEEHSQNYTNDHRRTEPVGVGGLQRYVGACNNSINPFYTQVN